MAVSASSRAVEFMPMNSAQVFAPGGGSGESADCAMVGAAAASTSAPATAWAHNTRAPKDELASMRPSCWLSPFGRGESRNPNWVPAWRRHRPLITSTTRTSNFPYHTVTVIRMSLVCSAISGGHKAALQRPALKATRQPDYGERFIRRVTRGGEFLAGNWHDREQPGVRADADCYFERVPAASSESPSVDRV